MDVNKDIVEGKWLEMKGEIQKAWGRLTNDELEKTKGDSKAIAGLVQQKYGEDSLHFQKKYDHIIQGFKNKKESVSKTVKSELKK